MTPTPLRRLPIQVRPAHNETLDSYIRRLAEVNRIHRQELEELLLQRGWTLKAHNLIPGRLSLMSGYSLPQLERALPQLRPDRLVRFHERSVPACPHCAARHPGEEVKQYRLRHQLVCQRHSIWVGPPSYSYNDSPVGLAPIPEVLLAQRHHILLVRRYGEPAAHRAFQDAHRIHMRWAERNDYSGPRNRRLDVIAPEATLLDFYDAHLHAAIYPETVALAWTFASPIWQARACEWDAGPKTDQSAFEAEVGQRIGYPDFRSLRAYEPINRWVRDLKERRQEESRFHMRQLQ